MIYVTTYQGFDLFQTTRGGKVGRGKNETASIAVMEKSNGHATMFRKYVRFNRFELGATEEAVRKAKKWIDTQKAEKIRQMEAAAVRQLEADKGKKYGQ